MVRRSDYEAGDEPVEVERPPRAGVVVSVRLSPEEADRLQDAAEACGLTFVQFVREVLLERLRAKAT